MWTYLPASIFSPATAASILPSDSPESDPEPCAMSSGTSTASKSSKPGSKTVSSTMPQSGTMSESSTVHPGVAEWISSLPRRHVNHTVKPASCVDPQIRATSSPILSESLARYSPEESMWRTCQVSMFDQRMDGQPMGQLWSESWPRSGTTVDGTLYPRKTLAHRISENGGGLWPTPQAFDAKAAGDWVPGSTHDRNKPDHTLPKAVSLWPTPRHADAGGMTLEQADKRMANRKAEGKTTGGFNDLKKAVGMWPTPNARDHKDTLNSAPNRQVHVLDAIRAALWPTPVADGDRTANYKQGGTSLGFAARSPMLPTPSATKNTPNTVDVADLVDSDGNPWELGRKPYDRRTGQPVSTTLADVVKTKGWSIPTPTPSDNWTGNLESSQQSDDSMHSVTLPGFVARFPTSTTEVRYNTPNTMDGMAPKSQKALDHEHDTARPGRKNPNNLRDQIAVQEGLRLWPTPSSGGESGGPHGIRGGSWAKAKLVENVGEAEAVAMSGGQLSATWVCWLMGLPLGWDSLEPLAEGAYEEWAEHMSQGTWWAEERGLPRLAEGQKDRVNRLKCLGNGIVPASGALAFITLEGE